MANIVSLSFPDEDRDLYLWLVEKSKEDGMDKSKVVRIGLNLLRGQESEQAEQLKRIEAKQDEILADLAVLKGRKLEC